MQRWWPRALDAIIALVILGIGLAEIWVPFESRLGDASPELTTLQLVIVCAALLVRRSHPLICVIVCFGSLIGFHLADLTYVTFNGQFVPLVLATFAVARHGKGAIPYVGGAIAAATMFVGDLIIPYLGRPSELIFHWTVLTVSYALGTWQRLMAVREEEARRRAVAAEVEAAQRAAAAVLDERTRIARELHDVVAHSMSVIVVQAGATALIAEDAEVRNALDSIRTTGSNALAEMRRLVTMLRAPDEVALREPQPGLDALEGLVSEARAAGLPVELDVQGDVGSLPAGVDLAAYRIVQEALSNTRQHATDVSSVSVRVSAADGHLRLGVVDDGLGSKATAGSGHGLIGMRERVALYGGSLRAEPLPGRGFAVEATLPLEPA